MANVIIPNRCPYGDHGSVLKHLTLPPSLGLMVISIVGPSAEALGWPPTPRWGFSQWRTWTGEKIRSQSPK